MLVKATLQNLIECTPPPDEILVVDGDSAESTRPAVDSLTAGAKPIDVRYIPGPDGLSRQRNLGIAASDGDIVVFVDDDIIVEQDAFTHLVDAYRDGKVIGVTGRVIEPVTRRFGRLQSPVRRWLLGGQEGTFTRFGYPRYPQHVNREMDVEFMWGCFMSARREAFEKIRFDDRMVGYALAEDQDFSYRLSRLGRIRYVPSIVVYHRKLGFASQDRRTFDRRVVENRAYLFRKNFRRTPLARLEFAAFVLILIAHRLVNREFAGALGLLEGSWNVLRR